jgi:hypothetical protein
MTSTHVVLRRVTDADGWRLLEASLTTAGDVRIAGSDLGDGVERIFEAREYEWVWTIPATSIPALLRALGTADDVLSALAARFSGDNATLLSAFLASNGIPIDRWSRLGD